MTLLGAPGSGKGFYGRYLAEHWKVPLYSASRILRDSQQSATCNNNNSNNLAGLVDSGNLVDCETVSTALLTFLLRQHPDPDATTAATTTTTSDNNQHYFLMDGFPRTRQQIDLMQAQWPAHVQIPTALHLNVPDMVCAQKIGGRRVCAVCQQEPNSADVRVAGFVLPPTLPAVCQNRCHPTTDWHRRPDDDSTTIVQQRLADYRRHERALIDHYRSVDGLCNFTPYHGVQDVPQLQQTLEDWFRLRRHITNA